jgi:hypothetical protein
MCARSGTILVREEARWAVRRRPSEVARMARMDRLTPQAVEKELRRALKRGARASRLIKFGAELVDILVPRAEVDNGDPQSETPMHDRAIDAEIMLRKAISALGGQSAEALEILYCLKSGTLGLTLEQRRQQAGQLWSIQADTFRRRVHEGLLIWDLAVETYGEIARRQSHRTTRP